MEQFAHKCVCLEVVKINSSAFVIIMLITSRMGAGCFRGGVCCTQVARVMLIVPALILIRRMEPAGTGFNFDVLLLKADALVFVYAHRCASCTSGLQIVVVADVHQFSFTIMSGLLITTSK